MVIQKIAQGIFRYAATRARPVAKGLLSSEKMALNYSWKGYKHKSSIVGGIRTGLLGGAIAGGFINNSGDNPFDGAPFTPGNQYNQKYSRFNSNRRSSRYSKHRPNCKCGRRLYRSRRSGKNWRKSY